MVITEPGSITDNITFLGLPETCLYAVDGGDEFVLIGGSMSYAVPDILRQIQEHNIDEEKIKRVIILHAHFDHCGAVTYFKRRWPWIKVTASERGKQLLSVPEISKSLAFLNDAAISREGLDTRADELGFRFDSIHVEETVGEGNVINCGDTRLEVIEVPGHASCSVAIYIPQARALFPSDAAGLRDGDYFMSAGNSNYDQYQQSLEKMVSYDVDVVAGEHFGVSTGEDARIFMPSAINAAQKMRIAMEESLRKTGNINKSAEELTDRVLSDAPSHFLPREVMLTVLKQTLKYISKAVANNEKRD